jgi:nicotinate-nucleotide adenylyltransferase
MGPSIRSMKIGEDYSPPSNSKPSNCEESSVTDSPLHHSPISRKHNPIPIPETSEATALLFFGGSFDPPHLGHTQIPIQAAQHLEARLNIPTNACQLVYVPAARSPHKDAAPTADHHRLAMLDLALNGIDCPHSIWTQELADAPLNPGEPSYWADTWAIASSHFSNSTNRFLIGADQALSMHRWRRFTEFWKDAIVVLRDDASTIDALINELDSNGKWTPDDLSHWRNQCVTIPVLPWSSTRIRQQIASRDQKESTRIEGLDPGVQSYIDEHNLYR